MLARLVAAMLLLATPGCAFGPKAIESSHARYNEAVKCVSEEQLLQNLVRLRYNDNPMRLDVSGIAAQYELTGRLEAQPFNSSQAARVAGPSIYDTFSTILPFASVSSATRPTVSLTPLDDPDTIRSMFRPSTVDGIAFLSETAWPVGTIFRLWVEYLNRLPNAPTASGPPREIPSPFEAFRRATDLMQVLQDRGDIHFVRDETFVEVGGPFAETDVTASALMQADKDGYQYRQNPDKSWTLLKKGRRLVLQVNPEAFVCPAIHELCQLLGLKQGLTKYEIVVGGIEDSPESPEPSGLTKIHIVPRSTAQAMFYASHGVVIPAPHMECGIIPPTFAPDGSPFDWQQVMADLFTVHSCKQHCRPKQAWIAVKYRDHWYYIDDGDQVSKITFTLMMVMARANLLSSSKGGPVLTLPVGR